MIQQQIASKLNPEGADADAQARLSPANIFIHIQKTAGSSLRNALVHGLPEDRFALIYPYALGISAMECLSLPESTRRRFDLIIGHFFYGIHRITPRPARYATFVRDPMERIRSHFWQHRNFNSQFKHEGRPVELVTVVNEGLSDEFDNLQLRMIAGLSENLLPLGGVEAAHMQIALANIRANFGFVGVTEKMAEDWPQLLNYLGYTPRPLNRDNVTPASADPKGNSEFSRIDWERVKKRHQHEIALFQMLCENPAPARP